MVLNERFETTKLIIHVKIILYIVKNNCELHLAQLVKSNKVLLKKKKKRYLDLILSILKKKFIGVLV